MSLGSRIRRLERQERLTWEALAPVQGQETDDRICQVLEALAWTDVPQASQPPPVTDQGVRELLALLKAEPELV